MSDLELIQDKLLTAFDIPTELDSEGIALEGSNNFVMVIAVSPLEKNNNKWFARFSPKVSFDDWTNADYIQDEFESAQELIWSLDHTESDIYKGLFNLLSEHYEKLKNTSLT